jgi:hypothetical protein
MKVIKIGKEIKEEVAEEVGKIKLEVERLKKVHH